MLNTALDGFSSSHLLLQLLDFGLRNSEIGRMLSQKEAGHEYPYIPVD